MQFAQNLKTDQEIRLQKLISANDRLAFKKELNLDYEYPTVGFVRRPVPGKRVVGLLATLRDL